MCYLSSSITARALAYVMRYAQRKLSGNDVMTPYAECGHNHVAIVLDVGEATEVKHRMGTFTVGVTSFEYQRGSLPHIHGLFLPTAVNRLTIGGPMRLLGMILVMMWKK
jgi:hypothetical protein